MKKAKKILVLLLCAILLVGASIAGTVAYLTADAEVENSFSVGNVSISMDEADVDEYGEQEYKTVDGQRVEADRVIENDYKLIPGKTYIKDPKITVKAGSEPCWVFIQVTNHIEAFEKNDTAADVTIAEQLAANGWEAYKPGVFYYMDMITGESIVDARDAAVELPTFTNFTIATDANSTTGWDDISLTSTFVKVTAYAVQAEGLTTVDEAWAALNS